MKSILHCVVFTAVVVFAYTQVIAQNTNYILEKTFHIYSPGRWDYIAISPVSDYLYVSHTSQVNILNKNTGDSVGVIKNTQGVHGIAFAPKFNKGYTSNGKGNNLTVFDLTTNKVLNEINAGENPDAIMYDDFTQKIYVCNGKSNDLTVLDPTDDNIIKTIPLGGKPETAVSNGAGKIFINIEDIGEIVVINTKTYSIEGHYKIGKGDEPTGLAIDVKTKRLFAGCGNKLLIVLDALSGKLITEIPIGNGCDGVAFDAKQNLIFCSNGDGSLTIIKQKSATEYIVAANAQTKKGARTLAIDEKTHKIYLPTADFEHIKTGDAQTRPSMIPGSFQVLVMSNE